ncbi:glycosyltransferase [Halopenitus persicus]|uniref:Glycosyltransferase involved in cell wall bisynthesis n=1 Tax=Halopenitus persicus TaxID=1048396 RepID=A0A1H3MDT8_9EURY|nr:glycosyltransferase [Halopenitus persicus]SDY74857.1 Glycosyltransferase involved in cell wall bisynthesis [Halopenitus persicus]
MKVLQIVSSFAPAYAYGGPARSSYKISKNLSDLGTEVHIYTTDAFDSENRYDPEKHGIPEGNLTIERFRNLSNKMAYEYNLCLAPGMARKLSQSITHFDIVHIQEFRTPQAAIARHYASKAGVPYVLQTRGGVPRTLKPKQKWVFDQLAGKHLFQDAARIIATSESESDRYYEVFPSTNSDKVRHVPNGVDLDIYEHPPSPGKFRAKRDIGPDVPVVLFVGRLDDMKGVDLLIDSFTEVHEEIPDAELFIVGPDDGLLDDLENQATTLGLDNIVHFVGPLYDDAKLEAYVDADVFVLPSKYRYESFGNVVIEAMACETAVVLTEKCGAAEWIPPEAGRTAEPNTSGIADGITEILNDDQVRANMAKTGRELVVEKFNWYAVSKSIEDIYMEVASTE